MVQMVKNLFAIQETQVQFLHQEDSLEKRMAAHSRIIAWRIPWTEEPGGLQSMGLQRVRHGRATNTLSMPWLSNILKIHGVLIGKNCHTLRNYEGPLVNIHLITPHNVFLDTERILEGFSSWSACQEL